MSYRVRPVGGAGEHKGDVKMSFCLGTVDVREGEGK